MEWISVDERLPPQDAYVLVSVHDKRKNVDMHFVKIAMRLNAEWFDDKNQDKFDPKYGYVTHWMPLPETKENFGKTFVDMAWAVTAENAKKLIEEYLQKEDVKYEIWSALRDGVDEFFQKADEKWISELMQMSLEKSLKYKSIKLTISE